MERIRKIWDSVTNPSEVVLGVELGVTMETNTHTTDFTVLSQLFNITITEYQVPHPTLMLTITMSFSMAAEI